MRAHPLKNLSIILLLLAALGSAVRIFYGVTFGWWLVSPDELAWETLVRAEGWRYDQLIHYPHEGGSIVLSLLARIVLLFTDAHPFPIVVSVLSFFSRLLQLHITARVFGTRVAIVFGLWTVIASPSLLPWGMVGYGLHALSAIFPFLLLFLLHSWNHSTAHFRRLGLFLGLSIWFSYLNVLLVPAAVIFLLHRKNHSWRALQTSALLAGILGLHLLVRTVADAGFELSGYGTLSVRGTSVELCAWETWQRLGHLFSGLVNAGVAQSSEALTHGWMRFAYLGILTVALTAWRFMVHRGEHTAAVVSVVALVPLFLMAYSLSPFYTEYYIGNHIAFRHLAYILPLTSLVVMVGLWWFRVRWLLLPAFLVLCGYASYLAFSATPPQPNRITSKVVGWVIGTKLGHNPLRLDAMVAAADSHQVMLNQGIGWGMSTALFEGVELSDSLTTQAHTDTLLQLIRQHDSSYRAQIYKGVRWGFSDSVRPLLDKQILKHIDSIATSNKLDARWATQMP